MVLLGPEGKEAPGENPQCIAHMVTGAVRLTLQGLCSRFCHPPVEGNMQPSARPLTQPSSLDGMDYLKMLPVENQRQWLVTQHSLLLLTDSLEETGTSQPPRPTLATAGKSFTSSPT